MFQLVLQSGLVVKAVLLFLFLFSVISWGIIFYKHRHLSAARKQTAAFMKAARTFADPDGLLSAAKRYGLSPVANVFRAVYADSDGKEAEEIRRSIKRHSATEAAKLESHLGFLATTGSVTPFVGLFGTVWGIMDSFRGIGAAGTASLAVVAPGIAEALIATAVGLAAAIPAVIAYNYYLGRVERMISEMEDLSEDIPDIISSLKRKAR